MAKAQKQSIRKKDGLAKIIEEQRKETIEEGIMPDYLPNAPRALIYQHKHPNPFKGKDLLGRLLTDPRMERSWEVIGKCCSGAPDYPRLWSQISYALAKSRTAEPSRTQKRDHFLDIKRDAEQLAKTIDNGPLDRLAYEYFPDDGAQRVFKADKWPVLGPDDRSRKAHRRIDWWPSMTDLLAELSRHAEQFSNEALTEERFAVNDTHDRRVNYFLQCLARYFRRHFNRPMKGVLADIASVVFEKPFDLAFVKRALRHTKLLS